METPIDGQVCVRRSAKGKTEAYWVNCVGFTHDEFLATFTLFDEKQKVAYLNKYQADF